MANTYCQLYVHVVFAVKGRESLILEPWREELYKYISGVVYNRGQKVMAIGGVADHVHLFVSIQPNIDVSSLVAEVKRSSSAWVNERRFVLGHFSWQQGFGAFSYSKSQTSDVVNYILSQDKHHEKTSFRDEYLNMLKCFDIDYDERYIFLEVL